MEGKNIPYARTDFGPPPPGYIPGLGRGAVGFITRSDIGPSATFQAAQQTPPGYVPGMKGPSGEPIEPPEILNDNLYDPWNGYSGSLFNVGNDEDDQEADLGMKNNLNFIFSTYFFFFSPFAFFKVYIK